MIFAATPASGAAPAVAAVRAGISVIGMVAVLGIGYWMWQQQASTPVEPEGGALRIAAGAENNGRTEVRTGGEADGGHTQQTEREPSAVQQANQLGLQAMKQKDYAAAVEHFRQALQLAPDNDVLQLNLARALVGYGQQKIHAGSVREAEQLLQEAVDTHVDDGMSQARLAQAWVRLGRRVQAAQLLEQVVEQHPECGTAWRAQGEIAFADGELNLAVASMEKASALAPDNQVLAQRLKFFRREQQMLSSYLRVRSTRFDCMYDSNNPAIQPHLQQLLLDLEAASDAVNAQLGLQPMDRLLVLLLNPEDYRAGAPNWSNGLYDGRIRVPFDGSSGPTERLRSTFRHEYTHAALHRVGPTIATWLHEGIAQYVEGGRPDYAQGLLRQQPNSQPSLEQMQGNWTILADANQVKFMYAYSLSLCAWLVDEYGHDALAQLVSAMQHQNQDRAFQSTFGRGIEELDQQHRQLLR